MGTGSMALWLRVLTALAEDPSGVPSTHSRQLITTHYFHPRRSDALSWPLRVPADTWQTYRHTQYVKISLLVLLLEKTNIRKKKKVERFRISVFSSVPFLHPFLCVHTWGLAFTCVCRGVWKSILPLSLSAYVCVCVCMYGYVCTCVCVTGN